MGSEFRIIDLSLTEAKPKRKQKKTISIPIYDCPVCGVECQYRRGLRVHLSQKHPEVGIIEER